MRVMETIDLKLVISQHPDCLDNDRKLKAVLLDLYPNISRGLICVLCTIQMVGIVTELKGKSSITDLDLSRYRRILEDNYGMTGKVVNSALDLWQSVFLLSGNSEKRHETIQASSTQPLEKLICPDCGHLLNDDAIECDICGCPREHFTVCGKRLCPDCGTAVSEEAEACPTCGCPKTYFTEVDEAESGDEDEPCEDFEPSDSDLSEPIDEEQFDSELMDYNDEPDYPDYYWEDQFE